MQYIFLKKNIKEIKIYKKSLVQFKFYEMKQKLVFMVKKKSMNLKV